MSLAALIVIASGTPPASPPYRRFPASLVALWVNPPALPPPQLLPTTLDAVLRQVAATIAAADLGSPPQTITPARTFVTLDPEPIPAAGGPVAALRPGSFAARDGTQLGTGRFLQIKDGTFTVTVGDQCFLDQGGQDHDRLMAEPAEDRSANLLLLAHEVEDLLARNFVEDSRGNLLSVEPVLFTGQSEPRRYSRDEAWAAIDLTFSLSYIPAYKK